MGSLGEGDIELNPSYMEGRRHLHRMTSLCSFLLHQIGNRTSAEIKSVSGRGVSPCSVCVWVSLQPGGRVLGREGLEAI